MVEEQLRYNTIINNIEFRMLRTNERCWIKVVPLVRISLKSSLQFILNDEFYNWDVYDENGIESHEIFFEAEKCNPSFYLIIEKKFYRIDFNKDGINVISIDAIHNKNEYIKEKCNCKSIKSSCWAKSVYHTSRPDKSPFNEM